MRPPSPERKRGKGLFVLAGLLLGLVLLFPRYADQPRAYFGALWQRVMLWQALEKLEGVSSDSMEIDVGNDGSARITSKYSILRVHPDGRREVIASPRQAREATGLDAGAFATSEVADDGTLWIGGWHGTLLSIAGEVTTLHSERESPPRGRIYDIAAYPDGVFVGGDGLWHIPDSQGALRRLDDGSLQVRALGISSQGQLVIASDDSVLVRDEHALVPIWEKADGDGALTALTPEPDGALLVGTRNGVVVLEPDGRERTRLLAGESIRGFSRDADGALWVATWQAGIAVPVADGWTTLGFADGLPDDSVSDIAIDENGQMWLAVYGDGAFRAPAA